MAEVRSAVSVSIPWAKGSSPRNRVPAGLRYELGVVRPVPDRRALAGTLVLLKFTMCQADCRVWSKHWDTIYCFGRRSSFRCPWMSRAKIVGGSAGLVTIFSRGGKNERGKSLLLSPCGGRSMAHRRAHCIGAYSQEDLNFVFNRQVSSSSGFLSSVSHSG